MILNYIQRRTAGNEGQYLPLGVYQARGFDTDVIEKECTDKKVINGFGLCYKLFIEGEKYESIDEQCRNKMTDMLNRKSKGRADENWAITSEIPLAAKRSSSSPSSYPDSSSRKRRRRGSRNKKDKMDEEKKHAIGEEA